MPLGGREWGTREGLVFKASEASRPGLSSLACSPCPPSSDGTLSRGVPEQGREDGSPVFWGLAGVDTRGRVWVCAQKV